METKSTPNDNFDSASPAVLHGAPAAVEVVPYDDEVVDVDDYPNNEEIPVIQLEKVNKIPKNEGYTTTTVGATMLVVGPQQQQPGAAVEELMRNATNTSSDDDEAATIPRAFMVRMSSNNDGAVLNIQQQLVVDDYDEEEVGGVEETLREIQESGARAEFISVMMPPPKTVTKTNIGIHFVGGSKSGVIDYIEEGSLFADISDVVQPGDQLVSINGKHTKRKSDKKLLAKLRKYYPKQGLILVFQNTQENARGNVIESVLTKTAPTSPLGIKVGSFPGGKIQITEIGTDGITAQSLLNVGDSLLMVNGVPCVNSTTAHVVDMLTTSPKHVHIVVQPGANNAVTIAERGKSTKQIVADWTFFVVVILLAIPFGAI